MNDASADLLRFVIEHTRIATPPLCPEIRLRLATDVTPLWEATESLARRTGLPPPFWGFAWPGGQALARHLLDHPDLVRGQQVLDFGSGGGIAAIAAALGGAENVTANDLDGFSAAAIVANAALNEVAVDVVTSDLIDTDAGWQVVLAGDVCYERSLAERVDRWLRRLSRRGALVLVGDPGRAYLPPDLEEVERFEVPTTLDLEDREVRLTRVLRVNERGGEPEGPPPR